MRSANGLCRRRADAENAAPPAPASSRPDPMTGDRIAYRYACRPERGGLTHPLLPFGEPRPRRQPQVIQAALPHVDVHAFLEGKSQRGDVVMLERHAAHPAVDLVSDDDEFGRVI